MLKFLRTWKLEDIEKRPLAVLCAILSALLFFTVSRKDSRELDSREREKFWQDKYIGLTQELLEKNNIIERIENENKNLKAEKTDSVVRQEVSEPLHNILKP